MPEHKDWTQRAAELLGSPPREAKKQGHPILVHTTLPQLTIHVVVSGRGQGLRSPGHLGRRVRQAVLALNGETDRTVKCVIAGKKRRSATEYVRHFAETTVDQGGFLHGSVVVVDPSVPLG